VGQDGFSPLSIRYCQRAAAWLRGQDAVLADNVARNTPAFATISDGMSAGVADGHIIHVDAAALADLSGIPGLVVERLPAAGWHRARGGRFHPDLRAVEEAAAGLDSDPHVIHIQGASP
jgi:hypothetical protein